MTRSETLEIWGGVECTVNRVGDRYFDQLAWTGHCSRLEDLDRFAELGITALRFPVLWERCERGDWKWPDSALKRLRELGIRPIAGLLHHGSGPKETNLLDPEFAARLAEYAAGVARRYPWIDDFTPVNEPMTTARFSGLYGVWYPHERSHTAFLRALVNQCRGTALAMRSIREVNPQARLVQTEDFGRTYSTAALAPLADDLNARRWLTTDLLCGRLERGSAMWRYLRDFGIAEQEIDWFAEHPTPPDLVGVNHYLTSDRFLDDDIDRYPAEQRGTAGPFHFADIEAVRRCADCPVSAAGVLRDAWARYGLGVAITEVHLGCTREEQMRWLAEAVEGARALRSEGVDVRAVTVWSMLGGFNWNSLVTRDSGYYETGAFDIRAPQPRATALARQIRVYASGGRPDHPVLDSAGWWRKPDRLWHAPARGRSYPPAEMTDRAERSPRKLWILGANGRLGRALAAVCASRGIAYCATAHARADLCDSESLARTCEQIEPWAVLNAAGISAEGADRDPDACYRTNVHGVVALAQLCSARQVPLVAFSSDQVFDGAHHRPYVETDRVNPVNPYGRAHAEMELRVQDICSRILMVRSGPMFGSPGDFLFRALQRVAARGDFACANDTISPAYVFDVAKGALDLLIDGETGIWHLAHDEFLTTAELIEIVAERMGLAPLPAANGVPSRFRALASARGSVMPKLRSAIEWHCAQTRDQFTVR